MTTDAVQSSPGILDAARDAALDIDALILRVDKLLAEPLYWFPVRHHSPAIARQIAKAIESRRPKVIFIEGPAEAQEMIEFLVDSATRPPVAIYSSFRADAPANAAPAAPAAPGFDAAPPRLSVWYPIVSYSPEYVAMSAAKRLGARAVFIDLPHYATGDARHASPRRDLDQIAPLSSFYAALVKASGDRCWSETWDRLFEDYDEDQTAETLRREVAIFCAAIRATISPPSLEADGTLPRERFMWQTIRQMLAEMNLKPEEAMVVCGGFHIFMDRDDPTPPPPIPQGALSVTVSPYSYFRISELSGYGAGNRAPKFYELCFEHHSAGIGQDRVVIDYVIDVIKEARTRGEQLSSADAIAATHHAHLLARMRGHHQPVLDDLHDALISCCVKGNPQTDAVNLLEAMDEVNIGVRLGRVTDRIGRLPIVSDFYEQLARLNLEEFAAREKVCSYTLDKSKPTDAARSAFLHRMVFLGAEMGALTRDASAFGQSIFKEHWKLKWSPRIEASLIERSLHGDTVELAATTLLRESLGVNAHEAGPACRRMLQAVDMDLPELVAQTEEATSHAIDHDERFHSLADALTSLLLLERYAAYRGLGKHRLADLLSRCFDRACFAVPEVASVAPEDWDNVVQGLLALAEPVVQRKEFDADLFAAHVERAARISTMPFLRGAFLGTLTEMRRMKPQALAAELSAYARGGVDQQIAAGDFLHGVLRVSRTAILLGASALTAAVDELLKNADHETFLNMVPKLRGAFETLNERQRDSLALHVAELYGLAEDRSFRTLTTSVGAAQLLSQLDGEVASIMKEWLGKAM
jgi:hypothetical protein